MALLSLAVAGCTQSGTPDSKDDTAASTPSVTASPTVSPGAVEVPSPEPGQDSLVVASGTGNSAKSWQIDIDQGDVWTAVECLGDGTVKVSARPKVEFTIPCDGHSITPTLNEITVKEPQTWNVHIRASSSVTWAARISQ